VTHLTRWMFIPAVVVGILGFSSQPGAQTGPASSIKFEVASIRPSPPDARSSFGCHGVDLPRTTIPLGRCVFHHTTLRTIISQAYPAPNAAIRVEQRIIDGPSWVDGSFFDIEAAAAEPEKTSMEQLRQMLQSLLKDRFHLAVHQETKEFSGYYLVEAKDGFKLKEAGGPPTDAELAAIRKPGNHAFSAFNMTLVYFADLLSTVILKEPVVDKTGIPGKYTYIFNSAETGDELAGSIFTALQEQLGLKLESAKIPFEIIVIDRAERPTPNLL
jgi:uncharacterized protein (TIGR03435 family)